MKKYLFILMGVLSIFFFDNSVNALSFTVNDVEYNVDSEEKLFDYCYYTYIKGTEYNNSKFLFYKTSSSIFNFIYTKLEGEFTVSSKYIQFRTKNSSENIEFNRIRFDLRTNGYEFTSSNTSSNPTFIDILYSNTDIYDSSSFSNVYFSANRPNSIIESTYGSKNKYTINYYVNDELYRTFEVEEGTSHELINYDHNKNTHNFSGWNIETENVDLKNITSNITIKATLEEKEVLPVYIEFPINKTEFYALLVEVGVLIMIIFLKWCFPFKMGSDLK